MSTGYYSLVFLLPICTVVISFSLTLLIYLHFLLSRRYISVNPVYALLNCALFCHLTYRVTRFSFPVRCSFRRTKTQCPSVRRNRSIVHFDGVFYHSKEREIRPPLVSKHNVNIIIPHLIWLQSVCNNIYTC